jgi:nitrite reductase (cytochrome c-552)
MRVLGDSVAFGTKAEALLRQALAQAGVNVPVKVNLELAKYLNDRGVSKLNFRKELELPDPSGIQNRF